MTFGPGGGIQQVTTTAGMDGEAAWSHDGTKLAFTTDRDAPAGTDWTDIFVLDVATWWPTQLTTAYGDDRHAAWIPLETK